MKHGAVLSVTILLGSGVFGLATLKAQSSNSGSELVLPQVQSGTSVNLVTLPGSDSCPIYMHAQQNGGGGVMSARRRQGQADPKTDAVAQHIKFILKNTKNPASIVQVKVIVYGTSGKGRAVPTAFMQDGTSDMSRAFDFWMSLGTNEAVSRNLLLNGFTSVQSISLQSVTYADGSTWSPAAGGACRIAPDPIVLIGATVK